jgi:NitT/TauT family transport system ATP-binding protein
MNSTVDGSNYVSSNAEIKRENNYAITISSLGMEFCDSPTPIRVLNNINLAIDLHEFVTIVGPSGCGKTTLLKLIGGVLGKKNKNVHLEGEISVNGTSPTIAKKNRMFGFAFQNPVLLPWRRVKDNVSLPCELIGINGRSTDERVSSLLELMEIKAFETAYPNQLSGGMQQRVNIARSLVHEPSILLMDEPFGALDEMTRERLNDALLRIHRLKSPTILFVTHNLAEAIYLSSRVVILSKRPATIHTILDINLPDQRSDQIKTSSAYIRLLAQVRDLIAEASGEN